ncbi:MAG: hypothetical protein II837_08655, partial [Treponema sp.]|nr:hypothetical protein [Treponema sp.]
MTSRTHSGTTYTSPTRRATALAVAMGYLLTLLPAAYAAPAAGSPQLPPALPHESAGRETEATSRAVISAESGGEVRLGRASIRIPAGALAEDTEISITRLGRVRDTGEALDNATERGGGYRFLPAGQQFLKEVSITLPYDRSLNLRDAALADMATYFYDTQAKKWTKLKRLELNRPDATLTSASTHFTDMINATLSLPDTASPLELNLNSIKELEAADPLGGMIRIDAPQGDAGGSASFGIQLQIPAGRRGMQPTVALGYTSGGGNGILGKGFSLRAGSSITTDTRTGLPRYDGHDVYLKDGLELSLVSGSGGEQEYSALSEGAFEKIERHAVNGADWWEVTDKAGTRHLYGARSGGRADRDSRSGYTA